MKKIILILLLIVSVIGTSGCGNYEIFDTTYTFEYVHLHKTNECLKIKAWTDYEGEQIQVTLEDDTVLLVSNINADLIKGNCPYCKLK